MTEVTTKHCLPLTLGHAYYAYATFSQQYKYILVFEQPGPRIIFTYLNTPHSSSINMSAIPHSL